MEPKHLYNDKILEDIERLHAISKSSYSQKTEKNSEELEEELKNSCLIMENEDNIKEREEEERGQRDS